MSIDGWNLLHVTTPCGTAQECRVLHLPISRRVATGMLYASGAEKPTLANPIVSTCCKPDSSLFLWMAVTRTFAINCLRLSMLSAPGYSSSPIINQGVPEIDRAVANARLRLMTLSNVGDNISCSSFFRSSPTSSAMDKTSHSVMSRSKANIAS